MILFIVVINETIKEIVPGKQILYLQDSTNYIKTKEDMYIVLETLLTDLHDSNAVLNDNFDTIMSTINNYNTNANNIYMDIGVLSFDVVKELLEVLTKMPDVNDKNLRAIIYDFNIYNLQTKFIENIQIIIEISSLEPYYKPKIRITNMIDSFYNQIGRENFNIIDILRIVLFFFQFVIAVKCYFEETKHVKGLKASLSHLISIRFFIGFIVSFIGFVTTIVKLVKFDSDFSNFINISVTDGFYNNKIRINSSRFVSFREIQIMESIIVGLLIYLVQAEILMLFSYKARKFFLYMKWAFFDAIVLIILLLFSVLFLSQVAHYFYGLTNLNYSGYGESFIRIIYAISGETYNPSLDDKKGNESSVFFTFLLASYFIVFQSLMEVVMIHNYRSSLLLEGDKEPKKRILDKDKDKDKV